tara:strand:+ start:617 stop:1099 length:483 start_codon:yes stop_codon:yes gene_type:complete
MSKKAFEVGMDLLKAQPCPVCGSIGAEIGAGCPVQAPAIACPIRRKETARSRRTELSRIGGQNDEAPMSLEEMRAAFIHNKSDEKDWYEDSTRDKELEATPNKKKKNYDYHNSPPANMTPKDKKINWLMNPKKTSNSLIDRARKANKENPRPGSADYKKE